MKNFFARVWADIQSAFTSAEQVILTGLESLAHSILNNGGALLMSAATAAVVAAEAQGGSGSDKLKAAQAAVVADLEAKGIPAVTNAVNGAIEAAVAELKHQQETAATAAAAGATTAVATSG